MYFIWKASALLAHRVAECYEQSSASGRPDMKSVSIVMLTRNRAAFTLQCLDSVSATDYPLEWIIVDNGSSDETHTKLMEWGRNREGVKFIWNPKDFGSCRARNQAVRKASGDLVLFIDNDVMLEDAGWLKELVRPISECLGTSGPPQRIVATAPLLLFPGSNGLIQCAGGGVSREGRVGLIGRADKDGPQWTQRRLISWAPTAALLIVKKRLLDVGGFDEAFDPVSVCEDIDLCCRLRASGERILFVGTARLRHFEGITFNHLGYDKRAYWLRHMRVVKRRWFDVLTSGTLHSDEELAWRPVIKDYSDLKSPSVRLPTPDEQGPFPQFFSPFLDVAQERPPSLRLAVVGCGRAALLGALPGFSVPGSREAARAAPFLSFDGTPDIILSAVCDVDEQKASLAATEFGVRRAETSYSRLLDDIPVEAVCICSPPSAHAVQSLHALKRGMPVLVEKPPVVDELELLQVIAEKECSGDLAVMVNLPWAFHPAVRAAKEAIELGVLGEVRKVEAVFEHSGPKAWSPDALWYREGGLKTLILDLGLHVAFTSELLLGSKVAFLEIVNTFGSERSKARCLVGNVDALFSVGWDAPKAHFAFDVYGSAASLSVNLIPWRIDGSPSSIEIKARTDGCVSSGSPESLWLPHAHVSYLGGPYRHFAECVRSGATPFTDLSTVANAVRMVLRWAAESQVL
jgi:predicted dehydrogenase/GT2 family glycosyltransferase